MRKTFTTLKIGHAWGKLRALAVAIEATSTREPYPRLAQIMRDPAANGAGMAH